jgi:hypothetical protein
LITKTLWSYRRQQAILHLLRILQHLISGNYTDLFEESECITGRVMKDNRWRINKNLLGTSLFCPVIRRTPILNQRVQMPKIK